MCTLIHCRVAFIDKLSENRLNSAFWANDVRKLYQYMNAWHDTDEITQTFRYFCGHADQVTIPMKLIEKLINVKLEKQF